MYYDHVMGQLRLEPDGTMSVLELNPNHERAYIAVGAAALVGVETPAEPARETGGDAT